MIFKENIYSILYMAKKREKILPNQFRLCLLRNAFLKCIKMVIQCISGAALALSSSRGGGGGKAEQDWGFANPPPPPGLPLLRLSCAKHWTYFQLKNTSYSRPKTAFVSTFLFLGKIFVQKDDQCIFY